MPCHDQAPFGGEEGDQHVEAHLRAGASHVQQNRGVSAKALLLRAKFFRKRQGPAPHTQRVPKQG